MIHENKKFIEFEKNKWIKKSDIKKINHIEKDYLKVLKIFLKIFRVIYLEVLPQGLLPYH